MTIDQMHGFLILLKNEGQGHFNSPEDIDTALNAGSNDKANEEKRLFESTRFVSDNLSNFKTVASIALTVGLGSKPDDYDYATAGLTSDESNQVDIVSDSEWATRKNDPIDPPSAEHPICAIRDMIEVVPHSVSSFSLHYLRVPGTMVFAYTIEDDQIVYNAMSSTDCDWPVSCHIDIILRACVYLGVPLSDDLLMRLKMYKRQTEGV